MTEGLHTPSSTEEGQPHSHAETNATGAEGTGMHASDAKKDPYSLKLEGTDGSHPFSDPKVLALLRQFGIMQ